MKKKSNYLPRPEDKLLEWLLQFIVKFPPIAIILVIDVAKVNSVTKDVKYFQFVEGMLSAYKNMLNSIVAYKNLLKFLKNGQILGALPVMPDLGTPPPAVDAGFMNRLFKLVQTIKSSPNYTDAIGKDLGIIGPDSPVDPDNLQPDLKIKLDAGYPVIRAKKGSVDGMDLFVNRGDGNGFVFFIRLIKLNYTDNTALPIVLSEWKYKGMYVLNNVNVGKMSNEESVFVKKA